MVKESERILNNEIGSLQMKIDKLERYKKRCDKEKANFDKLIAVYQDNINKLKADVEKVK